MLLKSKKALLICEICGIFFVSACSLFMSRLYELSGKNLVGVMFGSVNQSVWESCKLLLLPYLLWSLIELLSLSPHMRRFTAVKTLSLYFLGLSYICARLFFGYEHQSAITAVVCSAAAFALSFLLYCSKPDFSALFPPSVFLLFLFWAIYFSFTPFPPKNIIFLDPKTGLYGIIPRHIDLGASALDTLYYFS